MDKFKLRWPLNFQPVEHEGQRYLMLQDSLGIAEVPAFVPMPLVPILSKFDGQHSMQDLVRFGINLGIAENYIQRLAQDLDKAFFLDTPGIRERVFKVREEYRQIPIREAVFAGNIYPADPQKLKITVDDYLARAKGSFNYVTVPKNSIGMIAPHIDYHRGWQTYAAAYSVLSQIEKPDVVFLLGTAHQPGEGIFHLTQKGFNTPFGVVKTNLEVVESIAKRYGETRAFADEMLHKREHSLELQLPFLAYRFVHEGFPSIVPILIGSFHEYVLRGVQPNEVVEVQDFIGALVEAVKELRLSGKKVFFYGGVDFAHVGQHFGDTEIMSKDHTLKQIEARDRELLDVILSADEPRLFAHVVEDHDRRRICGFPSIYVMLSVMKQAGIKLKGHYIDYRQASDPQTDCTVTFAAAAWSELH